jgi:polyphosphate kinase
VRFLAIVDSNLSEFFEVRVASLRQQAEAGITKRTPDGMTPAEQLAAIGTVVREQMGDLYRCWNRELRPALEKEGIVFTVPEALEPVQQDWLRDLFEREIFAVLTPIALDPAHPFPFVASGSLNLAALLETNDPEEPDRLGVVQVPRVLSRILRVPARGATHCYVFLADTIRWQLPQLFARARILDHTAFQATRNTNLYVDDEEIENLLTAIEQELRRRRRGEAVRLEVSATIGPRLEQELTEVFDLDPNDVYECDGPVNLNRVAQLLELEDDERLKAPPFKGALHPALAEPAKFFPVVRAGDVLMHHPFDAFDSVVNFVEQAAADPRVLAIKQTLYRTSEDSPIARALLEAAERGKQVTVVVELKARFDEEKNIRWARRMEEAGVQIVFGDVRLKTHCKLILVVRREDDGIRRYAHIGTGNYNPTTARQYTDIGLFTADPEVTAEVAGVFNLLTSLSTHERWNHLMVAPQTLRQGLLMRIAREAENARAGRPAGIVAKLNAVQDDEVIRALYAASQAGVRIDLIVRGICCLRPGVPGLSETIRVRSIVDRFLEHSRIVRFEAGGAPELWFGSADWMPRNLDGRVEVLCRVRADGVRRRLEEILDVYVRDVVKARELLADGSYRRPEGSFGVRAQELLMGRRTV